MTFTDGRAGQAGRYAKDLFERTAATAAQGAIAELVVMSADWPQWVAVPARGGEGLAGQVRRPPRFRFAGADRLMTRPARPPRAGDFGLAKGGGALMAVVRLGTFSRYGHASICEAIDAGGRAWVIEPMPTGCRRRLADVGEFVWSDVDLTAAQAEQVVEYARSTLGLGYDWPAILGFVWRFWGAKVRGRSSDHADRKLICSELCVWAYRRAGVELCPGKAPGDVSPGDLDQWLDDRRRA